jgi:hypothetical protein
VGVSFERTETYLLRRAPELLRRRFAEERFLSDHLPGYPAYMSETRSRLVPGLW